MSAPKTKAHGKIFSLLKLFDRLHWLWLVLAAPFLLFPSPKYSLAMFVVPALWLLHGFVTGRIQRISNHRISTDGQKWSSAFQLPLHVLPLTPLNGALLLLTLTVLISLWATFDMTVSLPALSGTILGIGVYFAFVRLGQERRGWWISLTFFLVAIIGLAVFGLFGIHWIEKVGFLSPLILHIPPLLIGLPGVDEGLHPNEVAGGLLWGIGLWWCLVLSLISNWNVVRGRSRKFALFVVTLAASILVTGVIVLTQSRGGYIALALTLPILILISLPPKWRLYSLIFLIFLLLVLGFLIASQWEATRTWIAGNNLAADPALSLNTLEGRLEIWSRAIYSIQDFPFTGMGMNAFRKVMPVLYPSFLFGTTIEIPHAHNEFLQAAVDLGIPGLIALLALYIGAFWMLIDVWRNTHQSPQNADYWLLTARSLTLGLGGGLLAHMLFSLTDAIPLGSKYGLLFWMLLGLIASLHNQTREHSITVDNRVSSSEHKADYTDD